MSKLILEGEWTGYTSSQRRIVHREMIDKKTAAAVSHVKSIVFTDGTSLLVSVREKQRGEKVEIKLSYGALIRDAAKMQQSRVLVKDMQDVSSD